MMIRVHIVLALMLGSICSLAQNAGLKESFVLHPDAIFVHDDARHQSFKIIPGDQMVFEYESNNAAERGNHSEATTKIVFYIDPELKSFSFKDDQLKAQGAIYLQLCRCMDRGIQPIDRGTISGQKNADGTWSVEMDVYFSGRLTGMDYHTRAEGTYRIVEH